MASITGDTLQEQIQKAISAHGVFKFKLAHMVEAQTNEIQPPTATADNLCTVGQWLYEGLPPEARSGEHYRTVVDLHARFHRAAGEVASLSAARRHTEALEAMELTSYFRRISDQLVAAMEAWADAAGGGVAEPIAAPPQRAPEPQRAPAPEPAPEPRPVPQPELAPEPEAAEDEGYGPGGGEEGSPAGPSDEETADINAWFGLPPIRNSADDGEDRPSSPGAGEEPRGPNRGY
jgi:hypothetical protein